MAAGELFPFQHQLRPESELVEDEQQAHRVKGERALRVTSAALARSDRALRWLEKRAASRAQGSQ